MGWCGLFSGIWGVAPPPTGRGDGAYRRQYVYQSFDMYTKVGSYTFGAGTPPLAGGVGATAAKMYINHLISIRT